MRVEEINGYRVQKTALSCTLHIGETFCTDKPPPYPTQSSDPVCRLAAVWASFSLIHGQFCVLSSHRPHVFILLSRHWLLVTVKHMMLHQTDLSSDGVSSSSLKMTVIELLITTIDNPHTSKLFPPFWVPSYLLTYKDRGLRNPTRYPARPRFVTAKNEAILVV